MKAELYKVTVETEDRTTGKTITWVTSYRISEIASQSRDQKQIAIMAVESLLKRLKEEVSKGV